MSLDFPPALQNWEQTDPASLFDAPTVKKEANPKARVVQHLNQEAKGCSYLVLWLDCDREGENICFEVMEQALPSMHSIRGQRVFRAKFSAISEPEIRQAMRTLGEPNEMESLAVDARQELDLKVGVAFTRFQTRYFQGKYGNLDAALVSYGPCQIPTLNFCVERCQAINEFQSEPFWSLSLTLQKAGMRVAFSWDRGRIFDQSVRGGRGLLISSVKESTEHRKRPHGLNTVEMLKVASSALNMGPHHTMQIAERLYTQGYISYPRTESSRYPPNYEFQSILRSHQRHPIWGNYAQELLQQGFSRPEGGIDAGDHPPISPVNCAVESDLGGDAWRLYDYIARHFLASLSPNAVYQRTEITGSCGGESFRTSGIQLLKDGFTTIMPWKKMEGQAVPVFHRDEVVPIQEVELTQGRTSPPSYLSESDLISFHINNICERNYVKIEAGRKVVPTELGMTLIKGYQMIDPELCRPQVRAYVEKQIDLIARGKAEKGIIVRHVLNQFLQKFKFFVTHIQRMDALFEASFSPLSSSGTPLCHSYHCKGSTGKLFGKCGKCKRYMKYIQSRPCRLYCPTCEDIYRLPQGGAIKQYKSLECPLDGFELVLFSLGGADGKTFPLCPYCFSNPPFEGALKVGENLGKPGMSCTTCLHPSCPQSLCSQGVSSCPDCELGTLVVDPVSAPNWRIDCNKCAHELPRPCAFLIYLPQSLYSVKVLKQKCTDCGSALLELEWKKGTSPLSTGISQLVCCVVCHDEVLSLCTIRHGRTFVSRGGRRGGRGRSRGRGRHRGRGKDYDPLMSFSDF